MWNWFSNKPTATDKLIELVLEDRKQNAAIQTAQLAAMERMMAVTEQQSGMLKEWLALFANPPKPEVRVMSDAQEAAFERVRQPDTKDAFTPTAFDAEGWLREMNHTFADIKKELV